MSRAACVLLLVACACTAGAGSGPQRGPAPHEVPELAGNVQSPEVGRRVAVERTTVNAGRPSMGTILELTLVLADGSRGLRAVEALFRQAHELERIFTTYNSGSDLNRLSAAAGRGPQRVDPRLVRILGESAAYSRASRGAFDVTVGPLVALWRDAAAKGEAPSDAAVAAALLRVGAAGMQINSHGPTVDLVRPGMRLDLGAIAKGWALDRMGELLIQGGVRDALLDYGQSSILALGKPDDAPAWTVGLRGRDGLAGTLELRGMGFSVSGALGQYAEIAGVRYGHVVDPRTGRAITRNVQAAVVATNATDAEAWSTALTVLGPEGLSLVEERKGIEAHLLLEDGSVHTTTGWAAATSFAPVPEPASR